MSSEKDYSVLPEVTIIQESAKIESEEHKPKKLRVCAYARVSTEKEEQEYSFENQRDYYMDYISKRSDWEFVGIYSDFGLSGKNKKRPQFIKMIDDCHAGKIDRIITKSISRFARNTIDCIQTVRDLKECASHDIKDEVVTRLLIEAYNESLDANNDVNGITEQEEVLRKLIANEQELRQLRAKGYISESKCREETDKILIKIKEQETLIKNLQTRDIVKGKYRKSDEMTEQMAEFLVKATVKDWTITFEFQNGYKTTKEYTNGRAGNVNGKLCKH